MLRSVVESMIMCREILANYSLSKGLLRCRASTGGGWKLLLPAAMVPMLFHYFHFGPIGDHLGVLKTIPKITQHFIWKGTDADIRNPVRYCKTCDLSKPAQNTQSGLWASQPAQRLLQRIFIGYVGKFPKSKTGNSMLLVCVDAFSKFVWLLPVRNATTTATINALKEKIFATLWCLRS